VNSVATALSQLFFFGIIGLPFIAPVVIAWPIRCGMAGESGGVPGLQTRLDLSTGGSWNPAIWGVRRPMEGSA
jgi:hypothetical protein